LSPQSPPPPPPPHARTCPSMLMYTCKRDLNVKCIHVNANFNRNSRNVSLPRPSVWLFSSTAQPLRCISRSHWAHTLPPLRGISRSHWAHTSPPLRGISRSHWAHTSPPLRGISRSHWAHTLPSLGTGRLCALCGSIIRGIICLLVLCYIS
jgi:hypothetical protein